MSSAWHLGQVQPCLLYTSKDTKIPVAQFTAEGGYYFKILSDARKIVFVYAGASALPDMNR